MPKAMTHPQMPNWMRQELALAADPTCEECDGSGVVDVTYNSDPTISRELACACVERYVPDEQPPNCPTHGVMVADDEMGRLWHCAGCGMVEERSET